MNRSDPPHHRLEQLLSQNAEDMLRRQATAFDERAAPVAENLVLVGAGGLGRRTLRGLREIGIEPLCFVDSNRLLDGESVDGLMVRSASAASREFGAQAVFVVCIWGAGTNHRLELTCRLLMELGCERVISFAYLYWKYPQIFLPFYCRDLPHLLLLESAEIRRAFSLWADEASCAEFVDQLQWRLEPDFERLSPPVPGPQYFPQDIPLRNDENFVDCGAYDGDTLRQFTALRGADFHSYAALEPDPLNFQKLSRYADSLPASVRSKLKLCQAAAGAVEDTVQIEATGSPSSTVGAGTIEVPQIKLDDWLEEVPSWIKLDIEGAELDALQGAAQALHDHAPVVAVSVYHRQNHLWTIPLLLHSLRSDYKFFLRPHNEEGWDLVCYAVPAHRVIRDAG